MLVVPVAASDVVVHFHSDFLSQLQSVPGHESFVFWGGEGREGRGGGEGKRGIKWYHWSQAVWVTHHAGVTPPLSTMLSNM